MLSPSSCHSCVWLQASPLIFTYVAAGTEELALSQGTPHIYLYEMGIYTSIIQECIPVGCVPPTAVAIGGVRA